MLNTVQFSARSTSFGGSNEGSSSAASRTSRTRDERFSDYTDASRMFAQHESKGGESGAHFKTASHATTPPSFLVDGPDGFENFEQDFGDNFGDEEFESGGAVDIMDEAEKQFEESNRLQIGAGDATAMMHSFSYVNASFKQPSDASSTSDLLSRSAYFLQNTSKLGALDTTLRPEQRPDLGMGCLRSPDSKKSAAAAKNGGGGGGGNSKSSAFRADSKNETYTLSSAETTLQEEKVEEEKNARSDLNDNINDGELAAKVSAFAGFDVNSLRDLISKAAKDLPGDPTFYMKLVSDLTSDPRRMRSAEVEGNPSPAAAEDQNVTMNATSLSPFLPSFLETTCDVGGDVTLIDYAAMRQAAEDAPKLQPAKPPRSKINPPPPSPPKVVPVPMPVPAPCRSPVPAAAAAKRPLSSSKSRIPRLSPAANRCIQVKMRAQQYMVVQYSCDPNWGPIIRAPGKKVEG